jgi:hypothetical protein
VVLRYDGETHAGEVVAVSNNGESVRVRDDRNIWTFPTTGPEPGSQQDELFDVVNLGSGESDKADPREAPLDSASAVSYVFEQLDYEEAVDRLLEDGGGLGEDEVIDGIAESPVSLALAGSEVMRRSRSRVHGVETGASPDIDEAMKFRDVFDERYPEAADDMRSMSRGWEGSMYAAKNAAPLVQHAIDETGNDTLPEYDFAETASGEYINDRQERSADAVHEFTTEVLREAFGDEVTMFRGFSENPHGGTRSEGTDTPSKLREAKETGQDVEVEHRPAESWSFEPRTAMMYSGESGAVLETTVPVERIAASSSAGTIHPSENDNVTLHDGPEVYGPGQIHTDEQYRTDEGKFRMRLRAARGMTSDD